MSEEAKHPWVKAEKAVIAEHIEQLIIYEGEKPITAGDMLSACQKQVESAIHDARLKFDPELYVEREIEQGLNAFFDSKHDDPTPNCYLLIAPAGSGKTNLLCHLAQKRAGQQPTLLLMGGSLYLSGGTGLLGGIKAELQAASPKIVLRSDEDSLHTLHRLGEELNQDALILLDAINEYERPVEMRKALQEILRKAHGKRIKLLVTCRDYYWGSFKGDFWMGATANVLPVVGEDDGDIGADFNLFSAVEHEQALALYLDHYGIIGRPVGAAAEQCRHPLILRFFCETYRGQEIEQVDDIRLKELFDRYWEQKLISIANRMFKQGDVRLQDGLAEEVGEYLLSIASHMLHSNVRAIPRVDIHKATQREERYDDPRSIYGRIRDEFIILEEKELGKGQHKPQVTFVYEEFMEYVMARSLIAEWDRIGLNTEEILAEIEKLTQICTGFAQILGVMVYLALMLKEERGLEFWSLLLAKGEQWQNVVFEAFRKLPEDQLDNSVFVSLEEMLEVKEENIQEQVLDLLKLKRVGRAASISPSLVNKVCNLDFEKVSIARRAILALSHFEADMVIPVLINGLHHKDIGVRDNAKTALVRKGDIAVKPLLDVLKGADIFMYWVVNDILGQLGNASVYPLIDALKDDDADVWDEAVKQLGKLADAAVGPLIEALIDDDERVRVGAAIALGQLGDVRAVDHLIEALKDNDMTVRREVVKSLGLLGGVRAVDHLIEALKDDDENMREKAAEALGTVGDVRAADALIEALKDDDLVVRRNAIEALGKLGDAAGSTFSH